MSVITPYGRFMRLYRIRHNLLLKDISKKLGWTASYLVNLENGHRDLPLAGCQKIEQGLGFSGEDLREFRACADLTVKRFDIRPATPEAARLAGAFCRKLNSLTPDEREQLMAVLGE